MFAKTIKKVYDQDKNGYITLYYATLHSITQTMYEEMHCIKKTLGMVTYTFYPSALGG